MKKVYPHSRLAAVSLLSFIAAAIAFILPCPPLVFVLVPVSIITGAVALYKFTNTLDKASGSLFDDYGYC